MESWKRNNSLRRVRENDHEKSITGFELQSMIYEIEEKYDHKIDIMPEFVTGRQLYNYIYKHFHKTISNPITV